MAALSEIFRYKDICYSLDNESRRDELNEYASTMGIKQPEKMTKKQLCVSLNSLATEMTQKRPYCTNIAANDDDEANFNGRNMMGDEFKDIPPHLIYTFPISRLDDKNGNSIEGATVCADLRDLIQYLDTTEKEQDPDDDRLLFLGEYGHGQRPELFTHPEIKLPHSVRQDIRKRWALLTEYGRNPINLIDDPNIDPIVPFIPSVLQRATDLFSQMGGYPAVRIAEFAQSNPETLMSYLVTASQYDIMNITDSDIENFRTNPTVNQFIQLILRKADQSQSRNTFMFVLIGIINGDDLGFGQIQIPSPPESRNSRISVQEEEEEDWSDEDFVFERVIYGEPSLYPMIEASLRNDRDFEERALESNPAIFPYLYLQYGVEPPRLTYLELFKARLDHAIEDNYDYVVKQILRDLFYRAYPENAGGSGPISERSQRMLNQALYHAVYHHNNVNMIRTFVQYGATIHDNDDIVLYMAIRQRNFDVVKYFLLIGADVNAKNSEAASIIKRLRPFLSDLSLFDDETVSPLTWATFFELIDSHSDHQNMVTLLMQCGANSYDEDEQPFRLAQAVGAEREYFMLMGGAIDEVLY